jgi:hypothetical protein
MKVERIKLPETFEPVEFKITVESLREEASLKVMFESMGRNITFPVFARGLMQEIYLNLWGRP